MKKIYEKPTLDRRSRLSAITAAPATSFNGKLPPP